MNLSQNVDSVCVLLSAEALDKSRNGCGESKNRAAKADGAAILRGVKSTFFSSFPRSLSLQGAYKSSTICYSPEKGTWTELEGEVAEPLAGPACSTVTLPACLPFNK